MTSVEMPRAWRAKGRRTQQAAKGRSCRLSQNNPAGKMLTRCPIAGENLAFRAN
jgi:hypothetical protein